MNLPKFLPEYLYDPDAVTGLMFDRGIDPVSHAGSHRIAMMAWAVDALLFRKATFTRLYLWKHKLFNSALVEGTGFVIYFTLVPRFLAYFFGFGMTLWWAWLYTTACVMPVSFLSKYLFYNRWLFKPNDPLGFAQKLGTHREWIEE